MVRKKLIVLLIVIALVVGLLIGFLARSSNRSDYMYTRASAISTVLRFIECKNSQTQKQLSSYCRQLKMTAVDGKGYNTDCINQDGINALLLFLPTKSKVLFSEWIRGVSDPIDEQSKKKAYELYFLRCLQGCNVKTRKV